MFSVHLKLYLSLFQNINPREDTGVNVAANMFPSWKKKKKPIKPKLDSKICLVQFKTEGKNKHTQGSTN